MELSQYTLQPLRKDGVFILYRGEHRNRGSSSPSSILLLAPASLRPDPGSLIKIEHEYALRFELDPEWAVRSLAISHHDGQTTLVLEDPGGEPLDRLIHGPMEMGSFLRLAVSLASALGRLHARGLIHKDIKPPNILVSPKGDNVWLMGFGIASRLRREHQLPLLAGSEMLAVALSTTIASITRPAYSLSPHAHTRDQNPLSCGAGRGSRHRSVHIADCSHRPTRNYRAASRHDTSAPLLPA